ncbi:MAG: hypothetical protein LBG95_01315, partial [Treponema sp.]|nr:hypothetical protein [Treponema sp.]
MKIRMKLTGGFLIVVALGIMLGGLGYYSIQEFESSSVNNRRLTGLKTNVSSILGSHYIWRQGLT